MATTGLTPPFPLLSMLPACLPRPYAPASVATFRTRLEEALAFREDAAALEQLKRLEAHPAGEALLAAVLGNSPFLSRLLEPYFSVLIRFCEGEAEALAQEILASLRDIALETPQAEVMKQLRQAKGKMALLTALCDITTLWELEKVTGILSDFASTALECCCRHLLFSAHQKKEIELKNPAFPCLGSGAIVLAMGKLGARELNYSSDIDLILLFEPGNIEYTGKHNLQHFFTRFAQEITKMMQERTADGYVFRVDLRLRPDPASTPPAISTPAALAYYESVGQNWERAAYIRAKPVAGDIDAGLRFLADLTPYVWRKYLDFASIQDIHSIKRQIDVKSRSAHPAEGYNVKLGPGGIREIEFYIQIQQLIWGGKKPILRERQTALATDALVQEGLIEPQAGEKLKQAYRFLRRVEHHLQMVEDQQTHSLPDTKEQVEHIAIFMGYENREALLAALEHHNREVRSIYGELCEHENPLSHHGNLVFTGTVHDPETLENLRSLGFHKPEDVSTLIRSWHHGKYRATRSARARELLTELVPELVVQFGKLNDPDSAFKRLDEFLSRLPSGVQIFSLLAAKPDILELLARIMGLAPTLGTMLSHYPNLLDAVLTGGFYDPLAESERLKEELATMLRYGQDFQEKLDIIGRFKNEKSFQAGVQLLQQIATPQAVGRYLADVAEAVLDAVIPLIREEFEEDYGRIEGGDMIVIALGRLGIRQMTFESDLDLVFVYHCPPDAASNGEKTLSASLYYNRLAQRIIGILTALSRNGRLYEVDTRLRPQGNNGPLAASLLGCVKYYKESAWTFEYMALTKARVVVGEGSPLAERMKRLINHSLRQPRDAGKLAAEVHDMFTRVMQQYPTQNPWNVKHHTGGLMQLDFILQYLLLLHATRMRERLRGDSAHQISLLEKHGYLPAETAQILRRAAEIQFGVMSILRFCHASIVDASTHQSLTDEVKQLLAAATHCEDYPLLAGTLGEVQDQVAAFYATLIEKAVTEV
jgi:glutamate-ammonia-ligase adenylyltransferase